MGNSLAAALASACLVAACGQPVGPVTSPARTAFGTQYYVPPIYTPSFGGLGGALGGWGGGYGGWGGDLGGWGGGYGGWGGDVGGWGGGYGGWGGGFDAWGAPGFPYAAGFPNYVQPIYTPNIGNPFVPPPLAAGPWISSLYGTVDYTVGFPWSAGWNGVPAF